MANVITTINTIVDKPTHDIVPHEYYSMLVKDEAIALDVDISQVPSKVAEIRKKLIDYIIELGDRFKQCNLTIHTAVMYLDKALVKHHEIITSRIQNKSDVHSNHDHCNLWAV